MMGPPPAGARLGLYRHGDTVNERTALELAAHPAFPDNWAIVPSEDGAALTLAWGDACTLDELDRACAWNDLQMAHLQATLIGSGRA